MKSKKPLPSAEPEVETQGTRWAAEIRAECNKLTKEQRQQALARALQLIYGDAEPVRLADRK